MFSSLRVYTGKRKDGLQSELAGVAGSAETKAERAAALPPVNDPDSRGPSQEMTLDAVVSLKSPFTDAICNGFYQAGAL